MYKLFSTQIKREVWFPEKEESHLYRIDRNTDKSKADEIIAFCSVPRSGADILEQVGIKTRVWAGKAYIQPLLDRGLIKRTMPMFPQSSSQRFVVADYDMVIPTEEALIEYCSEPRYKVDIEKHFSLSQFQRQQHINPLIERGLIDKTNLRQRGNNLTGRRMPRKRIVLTRDGILEFCKTPKTRNEIAEQMQISKEYLKPHLDALIADGKLLMTMPDKPKCVDQQFVSAEDVADTKILSAEKIAEFCDTPKSRREIAKHFGIRNYIAQRYINDMVAEGKIKTTMPLNPDCKNQGFVHPDIDIVQLTEASMLEFCKTPRTLADIREYFSLNSKPGTWHILNPFIKDGRIKHTHISTKFRKFVTMI